MRFSCVSYKNRLRVLFVKIQASNFRNQCVRYTRVIKRKFFGFLYAYLLFTYLRCSKYREQDRWKDVFPTWIIGYQTRFSYSHCLEMIYRVSRIETSFLNWLRGRRTNNLVKLLCLGASGGVGICVSYTSL